MAGVPKPVTMAGSPRDEFAVSVLICTRNRPAELGRALESVARSTLPVHQVVVSDDSSDNRSRRVTEAVPDVVWTAGPRVGLGANRNHALRMASGSHVLFIDDDVELGEEFLPLVRRCWERLAEDNRGRTILAGAEIQGASW